MKTLFGLRKELNLLTPDMKRFNVPVPTPLKGWRVLHPSEDVRPGDKVTRGGRYSTWYEVTRTGVQSDDLWYSRKLEEK